MPDLHGISQDTFDDVIGYEVTSRAVYEHSYRGLTWPKEQSGATGGIGYDFGQAGKAQIKADWGDKGRRRHDGRRGGVRRHRRRCRARPRGQAARGRAEAISPSMAYSHVAIIVRICSSDERSDLPAHHATDHRWHRGRG